jgi:hypothetical protein
MEVEKGKGGGNQGAGNVENGECDLGQDGWLCTFTL